MSHPERVVTLPLQSKPNVPFNWNRPEDAHGQWEQYINEKQLVLGKEGINWLTNKATVAARKQSHPVNPNDKIYGVGHDPSLISAVPAGTTPGADTVVSASYKDYWERQSKYEERCKDVDKINQSIEAEFDKGTAYISGLFHYTSKISEELLTINIQPTSREMAFDAILAHIETYKPNKVIDGIKALEDVKALSDNDGRGFAIFRSDFERGISQLKAMAKEPPVGEIRQMLIKGISNVALRSTVDSYISATETDETAIDWRKLLMDCQSIISNRPSLDILHAPPRRQVIETKALQSQSIPNARSSQQGPPRSDQSGSMCCKCGRKGHKTKSCYSRRCSKCKCELFEGMHHDSRQCEQIQTAPQKTPSQSNEDSSLKTKRPPPRAPSDNQNGPSEKKSRNM